jgi:DNA-binding transcriptional MocR family regulator
MNVLYYKRYQALAESADAELSDYIDLEPANGGLNAVGWLRRGVEEEYVANSAAAAGVELPLLSSYGKTALTRPGVLFGFASYSEPRIRDTVKALGRALQVPEKETRGAAAPGSGRFGFLRRLLDH